MKNELRTIAVTVMLAVFLASCRKSESLPSGGAWMVNDTVYNVSGTWGMYQYGNYHYALKATSNVPEGTIFIVFPERPISSGRYYISDYADEQHIYIHLQVKNRNYGFESNGNGNAEATLEVVNNKLHVQLSKCWVVHQITKDSVQLSGSINEY